MKTESADFFLTKLNNYAALEYAYVYMKLGQLLGLDVDLKTRKIEIALSGSQESMDKFRDMWNKIDKEALKIDLDNCLSIVFTVVSCDIISATDKNRKISERSNDNIELPNNSFSERPQQP